MSPLNVLIVIFKLLVVIMGVAAAPPRTISTATTTILKNSITHKAKDINHRQQQQQQHPQQYSNTGALSLLSTPTVTSVSALTSTSDSSTPTLSTSSSLSSPLLNALRPRKRHRKRHSIWDDYNYYNENSTILEWSNPCGGEYHPNARQPKKPTKKEQKRIYNILRLTALNDFNYLNGSQKQDIDISNIGIWFLHNSRYKFLPKLKLNSSIALKRWYRNMQTYVATFAYLHRIQYKYDRSKTQRESATSSELKELLKSSRNMLCELETAVNKTYGLRNRQIPQITRLEMNKRLKLRTKQRFLDNAHLLAETDSIDLKFVKYHYIEYLKSMWQLLRKFNRRKGQQALVTKVTTQNPTRCQSNGNCNKQFNEVEKSLNKNQTKRNKRRSNSKTKHKLV